MSRLRRFLVLLVILLVVAGALWWLARMYLSSQRVTAQVASRLQAVYGAPVQVREADIGMRSSNLHQVQFLESNASSTEEPWLVIGNVQADIPLWDLIKNGAFPSRLTLSDVAVTLRFDKSGRLLTNIPLSGSAMEKLPDIKIESGQMTIRQEGHPDFVVKGIHSDVEDHDQQLVVTGGVTDPTWGDWTLAGSLHRKTNAGSATLKTPDVHFTPATLARLPFVPEKIWQQVKVEGDTAIDCNLRTDPTAKSFHYRIALEPRKTQVDVPSIELHADQGKGNITVQDGIINVADIQGRAADGEIKASGKLDFEHKPPRLAFNVNAERLDLDKLPKSWRLPPFGGRLSGHADLQVSLVDGKIQPSGSGEGMITGVRIPGAPESRPILLRLVPSGEGFRFSSSGSESQSSQDTRLVRPVMLAMVLLAPRAPEPQRRVAFAPEKMANFFGTGVIRSVDALVRTGTDWIGRLPKRTTAPAKPQPSRSYLEAQLGLDNVDIAQFVQGLKVPLPFPVAGKISFNVQFAVPLNAPRDLKAYRVRGTVHSPGLSIAGQELDELRARVVYSEGILRLEELDGRIPAGAGSSRPGSFHGTAVLQVVPSGNLAASLTLDAIPLERALGLVPDMAKEAHGAFSGRFDVRVPAAKLQDTSAWEASGSITSRRLEVYGLALENTAVLLRVRQGFASIRAARGTFEGTPIAASAELRLVNPYPFTGKLNLQGADLAALQHLSPEVKPPAAIAGKLDAAADLHGTLNPFAFQTTGNGAVSNLAIDQFKVGTLRFRWEGDRRSIKVADLHANLYGGELSGTAVLPLEPSATGNVEVRIQNLDVGALSKDVPNLPIRLEGQATGRLDGTLTAAEAGRPREFNSKLEIQAPQLRVQGILAERLHGSVDYRNHALTYQLEGETLGGRFHLNGQIPAATPGPAGAQAPEGHVRVEGVRLGRLARALRFGNAFNSVQGLINLDATFRHEGPHNEPVGGGRFSLDRLRWGPTGRSSAIRGEVVLAAGELRLRDLAGEFAQEMLRGQVVINLRQFNRSWFNVAVDQVEASRLLAPWPDVADRIDGPLQIRLRGRLGRDWYGAGEVALGRGLVSGVEVVDWRLPFDWTFAPGLGSAQVNVSDSTGQFALGRVTFRGYLTWALGLRVDGHIRFFNVRLRPLVRQVSGLSQLGTGQVSGRFDFSGNDVHSIDDLTGTFDARLQQTQALQLPVLQQVTPFLLGGQSSASVFQNGSLRGRLAGGVFRIDQLSFAGSVLQLFVDGTVTLAGRLNLQVTANTGNLGVNPTFVRFLGLRIPAVGPIPLTLLLEAGSYFSNRLIHLRVTGTIRSPIITIEPVSLLTEEALRFFVNRSSLPLP